MNSISNGAAGNDLAGQNSAGSGLPEQSPSAPASRPSEAARLVNTFVAPSKTFGDLRRNASWWGPFIVMAVFSVVFIYLVGQKVGFYQVVENQNQLSAKATQRMESMSPAKRENTIHLQATITRGIAYGFPALILIWDLIVALVLFGTFRVAGASDLTFKASFAVVLYAGLPQVIRTLLSIVSLFAGIDPASFSLQNPVATNPGYFLDPRNSHFLYSLGSSLDIFMIWTLILTAIGMSCVSKLKRSTAFVGVFGWFILLIFASAALSAAFS